MTTKPPPVCADCFQPLTGGYYTIAGETYCESCSEARLYVERAMLTEESD